MSVRLAVAALVALAALGCTSPPRDIIIVSVDTLRAANLGVYGYERATSPNVDRWFADSAVYTRAYSTDANTSPAIASMLTGQLPQDHGVRLLYQLIDEEVVALPDLLPEAYESAAVVSNMALTDEAIGWGHRFDHYDDYVDQREPYRKIFEREARRTTDAALDWFRGRDDPSRPMFLWVHYMDPHGPYHPPEDWQFSFGHPEPLPIPLERVPDYQREPGINDGHTYEDRYDEEIAYMDREVGRLLDTLAAERGLEGTLLLFTADHGESMMEHEKWFTHGYHVYDELVRIPLMVRAPGVAAGKRAELASIADVAATALRFAGVEPPPTMIDVDLRTGWGLSEHRVVFSEARSPGVQRRAAISGNGKWVVEYERQERAPAWYRRYRLEADPKELQPESWGIDDRVGKMLLDLAARDPAPGGVPLKYERGELIGAPKVAPDASPEVLERLKALGYVDW